MADITSGILSRPGPNGLSQIASATGADEAKAADAVTMAVPALLGSFSKR